MENVLVYGWTKLVILNVIRLSWSSLWLIRSQICQSLHGTPNQSFTNGTDGQHEM